MTLYPIPISLRAANKFVAAHHSYLPFTRGSVMQTALSNGERIVAVAICETPTASQLNDGTTLEITRLCTDGTAPNAASMLLANVRRIATQLGYLRLITYIDAKRLPTALVATAFRCTSRTQRKPHHGKPVPEQLSSVERYELPLFPIGR